MPEYRVQLDVFHGPMDLLLYLVRKNEVDINNIPIALIAGQYLQYVTVLKELDPESAAEFLVLAATLMEIKSRSLLPIQTEAEGAESNVAELTDPRGELIRQLLEYKDFKDRAMMLDRRFDETAQRFARVPSDLEGGARVNDVDLSEIGVWELLCAFERIMNQVEITSAHQVFDDDTPLELHATDILEQLTRDGPLSLEILFEGRTRKTEVIGLFLAVLQLIKDRKIHAVRGPESCGIVLELIPEPPVSTPASTAPPADPPPAPAPAAEEPVKKKRRFPRKNEDEGFVPELEPIVQPDPAILNADQVLANFSLQPPAKPSNPEAPPPPVAPA